MTDHHTSTSEDPIPNRIHARPVRRPGAIIAGLIVLLVTAMLIHGIITNPNFEWNVVWRYLFNEHVLSGVAWTLILTFGSFLIATFLAIVLAVMRQSVNPVLKAVSWFYIWFFRGTPVYTQLVFWGLIAVLIPKISLGIAFGPSFFSINTEEVFTAGRAALIGLALNEAAYLSEIVRAGLESVDKGQTEASQALGMNRRQIMYRIVLPQAMRIIVPPMSNEAIGLLKTTSLVLAVPFTMELQYVTNSITYKTYKPIPLLLVAAIWYLIITSILMVIQHYLEKYFSRGFTDEAARSNSISGSSLSQSYKADKVKARRRAVEAKHLGLNA